MSTLSLPTICPFCMRQQTAHHCKRKCGWWRCNACASFGELGGSERAYDGRRPS